MEFNIKIGGKDVAMTNSFLWQIRYKSQFKEDPAVFLMDALDAMMKFDVKPDDPKADDKERQAAFRAVSKIGFIRCYGMAWAMAKAADKSIPMPDIWRESFDEFPVLDVGIEVLSYAIDGLMSSTQPKNATAPGEALNPESN